MKLSFKTILPIILISALLILLAGCFGVPTDESPGYTPGTITGIIAAPCCSTSDDPVTETCCVSPEYWCYYCQGNWLLQDGIEVVLTYGEDEVATTTTNDKGEFTFTNVDPGKNYVVTAYCPDFADNRPLVKDVALQLVESGSFDTNITDLVSTSLGLVVDFLVLYTDWGPEDISLDAVLADRPNFPNFPKFKALIYEVRRVVENCEVNLLTDDEVQYRTCLAAEEISGLDIGCGAGFTPPPGPPPTPPGECDGNLLPDITDVAQDGTSIFNIDPALVADIHLTVGIPYEFCVTAADNDNILPQDLIYYLTIDGVDYYSIGNSNCLTITPEAEDVDNNPHEVFVNVYDGCGTKTWGPITVIVDCCPFAEPGLTINFAQTLGIEMSKGRVLEPADITKCMEDCVTISSVTVHYAYDPPGTLVITDLTDDRLEWTWDNTKVSFDDSTGLICLIGGAETGTPGRYTISVTYTDPCGEVSASIDVEFKDCSKYNVYYDANTGTGTQTDSNDYFAGDSATVKDQGTMLKANYTFSRWDTQANGLGDSYDPTDSLTMPAADVTLYAQWTKQPCVYLSYNNGTRCHDWIYVNIEDAKNLNKAVITLEQTNSSHVQPEQYSVGTLMSPGVCTHNTSVAVSTRTINITVTRNNSVEVDGDGNIVGVYFSADSSSRTSTVTIVGSTLYDKGNNVINHTVGTPSSLGLPGPGGWN